MKVRKKPVTVEAVRIGWENLEEVCEFVGGDGMILASPDRISVHVDTLEGLMVAHEGSYLIRGVKGELYPCKADIFDETYEKVDQ